MYFADNAHVPYGERPPEEIQEFALSISGYLIERGAKAVVMACNMSSAVALGVVREHFPNVPILGMIEPGAKAAVSASGGAPIGILATTGTVKSEAYPRAIKALDAGMEVFQQACPRFVPLIESGQACSEEAEAVANVYVQPLLDDGCRTLVLGCTHYPFVRHAIESVMGNSVRIVDPAEETVSTLGNILGDRNLLNDCPVVDHEFCTSGDTDGFAEIGSAFLGMPIERVRQLKWGVDLRILAHKS